MIDEDDDIAAMAIERAFEKTPYKTSFIRAFDGIDALEKLKEIDSRGEVCVILLDINMPRMNGHEFLETIRNDDNLKQSIVFVYSTSDRFEDVNKVFSRNVSGYIVKDIGVSNVDKPIELLTRYVESIQFPPKARA